MRADFEITTDHIDLIADTAVRAGALGARMTGGGFGGCVIALVPPREPTLLATRCDGRSAESGYAEPKITRTHPAAGAMPLDRRPG